MHADCSLVLCMLLAVKRRRKNRENSGKYDYVLDFRFCYQPVLMKGILIRYGHSYFHFLNAVEASNQIETGGVDVVPREVTVKEAQMVELTCSLKGRE